MSNGNRGFSTILGFAASGPVLVGVVGFVGALLPLFSGDFIGAGVLLIASGLAFGLLAVAVLGR